MIIKSSLQIREFYNLFLENVHIYLIVYVHIYLIVYNDQILREKPLIANHRDIRSENHSSLKTMSNTDMPSLLDHLVQDEKINIR